MTVEIPLKLKYRIARKSRYKGGHNNGAKKRPGYNKHGGQKAPFINHIPWVVGLMNGKRFKRPAYRDEVPQSIGEALERKGYVFPVRPDLS